MKDLSPEEAGRWMDAAPQIVQDAVTSPATQQVLNDLSKRFALHVDASGLLEKLTSYTLLGYVGPEEFFNELRAAGVSEKDARDIMAEVNQKIFMPLRKEEEGQSKAAPEMPSVAVKPPQPVQPAPSRLQNKIPTPIRPQPLPDKGSQTSPKSVSDSEARAAVAPSVVVPQVVRMTGTLGDAVRLALASEKSPEPTKLLEDHEEPHIEIPEVRPSPESPKVEPQIPQNLPGAMPPITTPIRPAFVVPPKVVPPTPAAPVAPVAPIKSYSTDPYREPVDEVPGA